MVASVKRNFVHIIVFAFAVVIIIIIIIITCSDPTARIIMLKVFTSQSFLFPYVKEISNINDEEWCLFYCDSTLGCPVIQDFVLCELDNVV